MQPKEAWVLGGDEPNSQAPDIAGRLLLEEGADLLDLSPAGGGIVEQVAQLARVGFDIDGSLCGPGVALEDEDLVLGAASLLDGMHGDGMRADTLGTMGRGFGFRNMKGEEAASSRRKGTEEGGVR